MRILIADNVACQTMISRTLEHWGFEAIVPHDGAGPGSARSGDQPQDSTPFIANVERWTDSREHPMRCSAPVLTLMRTGLTDSALRLLLIASIAIAGGGSRASAQTGRPGSDLRDATLEELMNITVTTASRTAEALNDAPARVDVVTAAQILRRGYRSLGDVLKDLPGFKVDVASSWDFPAELTVQGVRGTARVILLLDGIRISSPTNEPLPIVANYPVHTARQIEIVYGPASALYGADAFSAVINIITKDATESAAAASTSIGQFGLYNRTASYGTPLGRHASLLVVGQFLHDGQPDLRS
jgi:outer membrane receptor protein involved in Fe transport